MKAVMKSVSPRICEKVANGDCTILVSKTAPKCEVPFKCYIYCTSAKPYLYKEANPPFELFFDSELYKGKGYDDRLFSGKVIGEFVCDRIDEIYQCNSGWVKENACISKDEFFDYLGIPRGTHFGYDKKAYAWHISDLKIYGNPKELSEFKTPPCEKSEKACGNCKWLVKRNTPDAYECECYVEDGRPITRPPQSYMYVEEI